MQRLGPRGFRRESRGASRERASLFPNRHGEGVLRVRRRGVVATTSTVTYKHLLCAQSLKEAAHKGIRLRLQLYRIPSLSDTAFGLCQWRRRGFGTNKKNP